MKTKTKNLYVLVVILISIFSTFFFMCNEKNVASFDNTALPYKEKNITREIETKNIYSDIKNGTTYAI